MEQSDKVSHSFQLRNEGEVGNFLRHQDWKRAPMRFILHSQALKKRSFKISQSS